MEVCDPAEAPLFLVNPAAAAGQAARRWQVFQRLAKTAGLLIEASVPGSAGEARQLAAEAARQGRTVVACGGDGTVQAVANGVLTDGAAGALLAMVPLGTGNDFAGCVGIRTLEDAVKALVNAHRRTVDTIRIECREAERRRVLHALSFAAVGIVGELLEQTTSRVKRLFGPRLAYYVGLLRALRRYRSPRFTIRCEGEPTAAAGGFLFVGVSNTERAGGGMRLAPGALMDDGRLAVNLIGEVGIAGTCGHLWRLAHGSHTQHRQVRYFAADGLRVEADPPAIVTADGEQVGCTPARFQVQPQALSILTVE